MHFDDFPMFIGEWFKTTNFTQSPYKFKNTDVVAYRQDGEVRSDKDYELIVTVNYRNDVYNVFVSAVNYVDTSDVLYCENEIKKTTDEDEVLELVEKTIDEAEEIAEEAQELLDEKIDTAESLVGSTHNGVKIVDVGVGDTPDYVNVVLEDGETVRVDDAL